MTNSFYTYKFHKDENLVVFTLRGDIYIEDMFKGFAEAWNDPDYLPNCIGITDIRNCDLHISEEDIKKMAALEAEAPKGILTKWSILADKPKSVATLMLYELMIAKYEAKIFSTWKGATEFLGVEIEDEKIRLED